MFFSNRMQMQNVLVSCFTLARNKALSHEQRAMLEDFCKRLIGLNLNLNLIEIQCLWELLVYVVSDIHQDVDPSLLHSSICGSY